MAHVGGTNSKALSLAKGWVGITPPQTGTAEEVELPSGYKQLDYIKSSGTQYIDTGFAPNQDTRVVCDVEIQEDETEENHICSVRDTANSIFFTMFFHGNQTNWYRVRYGSQGVKEFSGNSYTRRTIDFNKNIASMNDATLTFNEETFSMSLTLFVFARNSNGTADALAKMKLYSLKIYDNGTLVRDFIPCKNASNTVGLYDLLNAQFYGSAGSEAFIAGNIISSAPAAYSLKAGWMGDVNGKARKIFGAAGYIWDKYAATTVQSCQEAAGESTTYTSTSGVYVGSSYSFDASTGQFTVEQDTRIARSSTGAKNAIGKYYVSPSIESGTYTGSALYLITDASYSILSFTLTFTITPYTAEAVTIYVKGDLLGTATSEDVSAYPMNGIADDGYWYVLQNDIALLDVSYSGTYTNEVVTMQAGDYRLLTLTSSGTLAIAQSVSADIWICGGGAGGKSSGDITTGSGGGGNGAYASVLYSQTIQNLTIVIGSGGTSDEAGTSTTITGDTELSANRGTKCDYSADTNSGTGGGGGYDDTDDGELMYRGMGDGLSKLPFDDSFFPAPFCDGGGGGGSYSNKSYTKGGNGGTNGGNGSLAFHSTAKSSAAAKENMLSGGLKGGLYGGNGAYLNVSLAESACGYGSGGGGGGGGLSDGYNIGGAGYQGVCFIRIPLN